MAPPTIHFTVGLGVEIILIMEEDHERLQRITETFETMSVTTVSYTHLTLPTIYSV